MDPHVQLVRRVFHECDVDSDGHLQMEELHFFALETGFDEGREAWVEEYSSLCAARGVDPTEGFSEADFKALVEDDSASGCNCSDEELRGALARLQATRAWRRGGILCGGAGSAGATADGEGTASGHTSAAAGSAGVSAGTDSTVDAAAIAAASHLDSDANADGSMATGAGAATTDADAAASRADASSSGSGGAGGRAAAAASGADAAAGIIAGEVAAGGQDAASGADAAAGGAVPEAAVHAAGGAPWKEAGDAWAAAAPAGENKSGSSSGAMPKPLRSLTRPSFHWHCGADDLDKQLRGRLSHYFRTVRDEAMAAALMQRLEALLQKHLPGGPCWRLVAFGSAANGFGTPDCDLDVTALGRKAAVDDRHDNSQELLRGLGPVLQASDFHVEEAVLHARVPILRLRHGYQEVDLSLNNKKALQNTRLLKAYAQLDRRVVELGVAVKLWAKDHLLCGATSGHLSSYALTLMTIYFLQVARKMPVLQAVGDHRLSIEDCGVWDERARFVAADGWRLAESMGALLDAFFAFYARDFYWASEVVCPRLGMRLPAGASDFEQLRGRHMPRLHIEDPLERSRNLQDVLTPDNEWRIYLAFRTQHCALRGLPMVGYSQAPPVVSATVPHVLHLGPASWYSGGGQCQEWRPPPQRPRVRSHSTA